jgi:GcrA cell cycle regulator
MSWTDERVTLLKKLWCEGKTAAEIAKELGSVTRNAVIGKAHRLKLSNRVSPIQQGPVKPAAPRMKAEDIRPEPVRRVAPANSDAAPIKVKGVSMVDLKDKMCRWPLGDPKDPKFHFCGCNSVPGLPYCTDHAKMAYQTATRRVLQAEDFEDRAVVVDEDDVKEAVSG